MRRYHHSTSPLQGIFVPLQRPSKAYSYMPHQTNKLLRCLSWGGSCSSSTDSNYSQGAVTVWVHDEKNWRCPRMSIETDLPNCDKERRRNEFLRYYNGIITMERIDFCLLYQVRVRNVDIGRVWVCVLLFFSQIQYNHMVTPKKDTTIFFYHM